jgi:hypothetical protein
LKRATRTVRDSTVRAWFAALLRSGEAAASSEAGEGAGNHPEEGGEDGDG